MPQKYPKILHPHLATVDHIICSPLGCADVHAAARAAHAVMGRLAEGPPPVPVYLCAPAALEACMLGDDTG